MGVKKGPDGLYHIGGKTFSFYIGSRRQVGNGNAYKTAGGLRKHQLKKNKRGRWVSRRMSDIAKKQKRLIKKGYGTKKGTFGYIKIKKRATQRRKKRGKRRR